MTFRFWPGASQGTRIGRSDFRPDNNLNPRNHMKKTKFDKQVSAKTGGEADELAGLMHDLANEQFKLHGWLDLARDAADEAGRQWAIEKGLSCVPGLRALLDQVDALRGGTPLPAPPVVDTDTGAVLMSILERCQPLLPDGVTLWPSIAQSSLHGVTITENDLDRVLTNLLKNPAEAMAQTGGVIAVMASNVTIQADAAYGETVPPGQYVLIGVQDNGPGIAPEVMARLFEPYVTFGKEGGTGLGLASVKRLVEACGGHVTCDSTPGKGARFSLWLPAMQG